MKAIATDLDRTLIPNGSHILSKGAMGQFKTLIKKNKIKLIFVTGRHAGLIRQGIKRYSLPKPDYCIALLGTVIYKYSGGKLIEDKAWQKVLAQDWKKYKRKDVAEILSGIKEIKEQGKVLLNDYKQSYYVDVKTDSKKLVKNIAGRLKKKNIKAEIIYSVDVNRNIGLLDIIPKKATKAYALQELLKKLKIKKTDTIYAGDSGNDILPLTSGYNAVLVKNANAKVKDELIKSAKKKKVSKKIYIAKGNSKNLNGNYVSGIIEGGYYFGFFG